MEIIKCPDCGGPQLLPNGEICKNCTLGMVVMCSKCNIMAIEKGEIPVSQHPEWGPSKYILYQCPKCMSVEIINLYSSHWYEL